MFLLESNAVIRCRWVYPFVVVRHDYTQGSVPLESLYPLYPAKCKGLRSDLFYYISIPMGWGRCVAYIKYCVYYIGGGDGVWCLYWGGMNGADPDWGTRGIGRPKVQCIYLH